MESVKMRNQEIPVDLDNIPVMPFRIFVILLGSIAFGTLAAVLILPTWLPGLTNSLLGTDAKVFWYLSRSSAMAAFILIWMSMALGIMITNKMARIWPGGPKAYDLHQFGSLIGLFFAIFHALILLGDEYMGYDLVQIIIPFQSESYRPIWVGLGQISVYLLLLIILSFYVRSRISRKVWRLIHFLSYLVFFGALLHGILSGSDTELLWVQIVYWSLLGSVLFLTLYRILTSIPLLTPKKTT